MSVTLWCLYALLDYRDGRPAGLRDLSISLVFCCWEINCCEGQVAGIAWGSGGGGGGGGSLTNGLDYLP